MADKCKNCRVTIINNYSAGHSCSDKPGKSVSHSISSVWIVSTEYAIVSTDQTVTVDCNRYARCYFKTRFKLFLNWHG